jgi:hypothetical protein
MNQAGRITIEPNIMLGSAQFIARVASSAMRSGVTPRLPSTSAAEMLSACKAAPASIEASVSLNRAVKNPYNAICCALTNQDADYAASWLMPHQ